MSLSRLFGAALLAALSATLTLTARADTGVDTFSPQGVVKDVRQARAHFTQQMAAFGDLRVAAPFDVACAVPGNGRWADGQNWVYDFERDLPGGLQCTFTLKAGLKDLAGAPVSAPAPYRFSTGGPAVVMAVPPEGRTIDENQIFILGLDAVAQTATIEKNVYCAAAGINEKIGVRLITGKQRDELLALRKNVVDRYLGIYFKARGQVWRVTLRLDSKRMEQLPIAVLQCQRPLPAASEVTLVWGAGVASSDGIAGTADQKLSFETRSDFSAKFECQRVSVKSQCIPFLPVSLYFTSPVLKSEAARIALTEAKGAHRVHHPVFDRKNGDKEFVDAVTFAGPFAEKSAYALSLPAGLKDDSGRALVNAARFPLAVRTDEQPPLLKFPARFGILEARGDRLLPVTVRNLEATLHARIADAAAGAKGAILRVGDDAGQKQDANRALEQDRSIIAWMKRLGKSEYSDKDNWSVGETRSEHIAQSIFERGAKTTPLAMPKPGGGRAFEVVGIPLPASGFYVVELNSPKLGAALNKDGRTGYVQAGALVTNLAAHFKHGAESSLVWVTTLDKGGPVAGARVAVLDCLGKPLWQGASDKNGIARIPGALEGAHCGYEQQFFVSARSAGDMTFTLSNWVGGIETYRFNVPTDSLASNNIMATTVFDRTLLRAGETVHMKHFLRKHTSDGIALPDGPLKEKQARSRNNPNAQAGDAKLIVTHIGSNQRYEFPLTWAANATAETEWKIPLEAKQGEYSVAIGGYQAGSFRVEQFRVPTMKALLQPPKTPLVQATQLDLDVQLDYLSGGAAANAPVKLRTVIEPKSVSFPGYPNASFSTGDVKEGVVREAASFDEDNGEIDDGEQDGTGNKQGAVKTRSLTLSGAGAARVAIDQIPAAKVPQDMLAELEYQDANGETLTASTRIALWPSKVALGIEPDGWVASRTGVKFKVIALNLDGTPKRDAAVVVDFFQRVNYSHRRRLIGGFYAFENTSEIKRLGRACEGKTDAKGLLYCDVKAPGSGELILRAVAADEEGRPAVTNHSTWVAGNEEWWFRATDNDRIDVLPEKKRVEPGQDATFQVRMPFRSATALVSVEREGIIDTYIRRLSGKNPSFSIPMKASYAPNVYVSVLAVRGRVNGVQPTALVDLGKPAYKMGIAALQVGWQTHELKVAVEADKPVYKTRDLAKVKIRVARADGRPVPAGTEVAVAAVDVGLLELMPNESWNLLEAMMERRGLQVETSTAQMQVIGKRHFGRKAFAHGGGGGKSAGRELFETLLFWKARVAVDAEGFASVEVPLNDALTSFRIVAIANGGADLFGTGKTDIRSTQDLIATSGLPTLTREGDRLRAAFSLRNTAVAAMTVAVDATLGHTPDGGKPQAEKLARQQVVLAAGEAKEVAWDITVPNNTQQLQWDVTAQALGAGGETAADSKPASDKLRMRQQVIAAVPVRTYQATMVQVDKPVSMRVQMPADALPGRGGIATQLTARLGRDLPAVREYMAAYPYTCFEQISSKAIALRDDKMWNENMKSLPSYLDSDGLLKYFTVMDYGSETLTAYLLSSASEAGYVIPQASREKMEQALIAFVEGRLNRRSVLPTADLAIRKMAALEALSRSNKVQPAMLDSLAIAPNLWPTSAVLDWYLVLQRTAALPGRAEKLAQVEQIVRSRLNFQGTTMGFSTERSDDLWWLMVSGDVNANRLVLAMLDNPRWQDDVGRLVRGALGRQRKGRWNTTVANAWGVLAIEKFSKKFETVAVAGNTVVALDGKNKALDWAKQADGGSVSLPWPKGQSDLTVAHNGAGKPWATLQSLAAIPLKNALSSGYTIGRTVTPVVQKQAGVWSRGDVYRVHLDLQAQADMTWVVVDDPIPAGASILGNGLGRDSKILSGGQKAEGWTWPAFEERKLDAFRSYFEFVPKGKWSVEYTVRLNTGGQFSLPPTRVEAMYAPEMFGALPNAAVNVAP